MYQITLPKMIIKEPKYSQVTNSMDVYDACKDMADLAQECFIVLTLNAQNKIIDKHICTIGLLNSSIIHPREVFINAITDRAHSIIAVHNHPSGTLRPSNEDLKITRQLIKAGEIIGIKLIDHIIIGPGEPGYLSMRDDGFINF